VTPTVYDNWLTLTSRVLLNETDTAFTVCAGERSTADSNFIPTATQFHPLRGMRDDLDTFLIANSLGDEDHVRMSQNPANGWDFAVEPVPDKASVGMWTSTAHEIGHSFHLTDEYGGGGEISAEEAAKLAPKPNVQASSDLDAVPAMSTAKIKWRWPRIQRAGILAANVVDASGIGAGPFTVTLQPGHGESFAKDDFARLPRPVGCCARTGWTCTAFPRRRSRAAEPGCYVRFGGLGGSTARPSYGLRGAAEPAGAARPVACAMTWSTAPEPVQDRRLSGIGARRGH
jgi:hypothetical protein